MFLLMCVVAGLQLVPALSAASGTRVQITEPFLDLHTGPGRGYPVTQSIPRGEWVEVLGRRTDWFEVRTANGKEGWVSREQIETTMTEAGEKTSFREATTGGYWDRRLEAGFAGGVVRRDPFVVARVGYRFTDNLYLESALGQITGDFSDSTLHYVSVRSKPFPEWRLSPFFSLGIGRFYNKPRATLVGATETRSNMANAAVGVDYEVTRRLYVRSDYRRYIVFVDENRINEYNEISLGVGLFF